MKAFLEVVELKDDIITASGNTCAADACNGCDYGCPGDFDQLDGNYEE